MKNIYPKDSSLIHSFEINDKYFVFDTNSRVFFSIDRLAWDVLHASCKYNNRDELVNDLSNNYEQASISKALNQLENLEKRRILFSPDLAKAKHVPLFSRPAYLCLNVAQDCNLRCVYCYAKAGTYGSSKPQLMSSEVARAAVDFLICNSDEEILGISFFGGEPLLNFPVIEETVEYAREKAKRFGKIFDFGVTTNATILDKKKIDYIRDNQFGVIVSLDGSKRIHDSQRSYKNGMGSYDRVVKNLDAFIASGKEGESVLLRGTFTPKECNLTEMALTMKERGYRDFSLEPAYTDISDLKWRDSDIESIKSQYKELAEQYIKEVKKKEPFNFFHFNIMMESADKQTFNTIQCGAGLGYLGVSAEGGIYPCHKLVGDERYKMGDIFNGISADDIQRQFMQAHVFDKEKCFNCWAKYVCGGGCNAYNIFFNDNIKEPYHIECEMMKYRIELGAYIYSELTTYERKSLGYLSQQGSHGKCLGQSIKCS